MDKPAIAKPEDVMVPELPTVTGKKELQKRIKSGNIQFNFIFEWTPEEKDELTGGISKLSKGKFNLDSIDIFLQGAAVIIVSIASHVPPSKSKPTTLKQDMKTLEDLNGLSYGDTR